MKQETDKAQQYYQKSKTHKNIKKEIHPLAMWSFGIGIAPLAIFWLFVIPFVGIILALISIPAFITAIILGIIALTKISKEPTKYTGFGFALTGIILNTLYIILVMISTIAFLIYI